MINIVTIIGIMIGGLLGLSAGALILRWGMFHDLPFDTKDYWDYFCTFSMIPSALATIIFIFSVGMK